MRHVLCVLALAGLLGIGASSLHAQVVEEIDDFTGDHVIESEESHEVEMDAYDGYAARMIATYAEREGEGTRWKITIEGYTVGRTSMAEADEMLFVADGERHRPYRTVGDVERHESGVLVETHEGHFKRSVYETLAEANTVRLRIGEEEFTLPNEARADMRAILDAIPAW